MPEFFGKRRKSKTKEKNEIPDFSKEDGNESPTERLRFNNRGQTMIRHSREEEFLGLHLDLSKSDHGTGQYQPNLRVQPNQRTQQTHPWSVQPKQRIPSKPESPPTPLRFQNKSGVTLRDKTRQRGSDKRKKLGKRRSDLGPSQLLISNSSQIVAAPAQNNYGGVGTLLKASYLGFAPVNITVRGNREFTRCFDTFSRNPTIFDDVDYAIMEFYRGLTKLICQLVR